MIRFTDLAITVASEADRATGLLAYVALTLPGDLRVDGITLRRSADRQLYVSYPERKATSGKGHPILRPLTPAARAELDGLILAEVRRQRGVT